MDTEKLTSICYAMCDYYVKQYPLEMMHENYENLVKNQLIENIRQYNNENIIEDDDILDNIINTYFEEKYVRRCNGNTYLTHSLDDSEHQENMKKTLNKLKNIEQPEQRTTPWYEFRYNHLTASNLWKVFGTKSSINQLI